MKLIKTASYVKSAAYLAPESQVVLDAMMMDLKREYNDPRLESLDADDRGSEGMDYAADEMIRGQFLAQAPRKVRLPNGEIRPEFIAGIQEYMRRRYHMDVLEDLTPETSMEEFEQQWDPQDPQNMAPDPV